MPYILKFTDGAKDNIKALDKGVRNALRKELERVVAVNPVSCSEALVNELEGCRSFHYHEYRVVYVVLEELNAVSIAGVGRHDKDAELDIYRRLEASAKTGKLAKMVLETLRGIEPP